MSGVRTLTLENVWSPIPIIRVWPNCDQADYLHGEQDPRQVENHGVDWEGLAGLQSSIQRLTWNGLSTPVHEAIRESLIQ